MEVEICFVGESGVKDEEVVWKRRFGRGSVNRRYGSEVCIGGMNQYDGEEGWRGRLERKNE